MKQKIWSLLQKGWIQSTIFAKSSMSDSSLVSEYVSIFSIITSLLNQQSSVAASEMSFKIGAFKNCVIFTGSTHVGVSFPMNIAKFLRTSVFYRAPFVATDFFKGETFISEPGYSVYFYYFFYRKPLEATF